MQCYHVALRGRSEVSPAIETVMPLVSTVVSSGISLADRRAANPAQERMGDVAVESRMLLLQPPTRLRERHSHIAKAQTRH